MKENKKIIRFVSFLILSLAVSIASAEKTPIENLYQYKMENGLSVFITENHTVPLVYIEIAVRAGAITQTPETAGLFHLYEHMMFKGNRLYKDAASVNRAISNLGVANWNGTTGINHVNYFFTIPSDKIEEGLAFWNAAIRSPLMDERELQNEKKVVLSEIEGGESDPSKVFYEYLNTRLFPEAPYKVDSGGSFDVIKNATVSQLREIQDKYYIPSNAALFIGGDIDPDETYELAEKIFGSWSNNGNQPPKNSFRQNTAPFDSAQFCIMPFDKTTEEIAQILIQFRGPDSDFDIEDTYATDYLMYLLNEPNSIYVQKLYNNSEFKIPDFNNSWAQYGTVRANGLIEFGTVVTDTEISLAERTKKILYEIQNSIIPQLVEEKKLFSESYKAKIIERIKDSQTQSTETASGLLSSLRSWWVNASAEYFYDYYENLSKVTQDDVKHIVEKYITGKNPLVSILVNPEVYKTTESEFKEEGFYKISLNETPWWKMEKFAVTPPKDNMYSKFTEDKNIYIPQNKKSEKSDSSFLSRNIEIQKLKNGIPVYINHTNDKIYSMAILCSGGVENLTPETSGLETTLFSFMADSSKKYSYKKRTEISYETNSTIGYFSKLSGSALYLNVMDKYFEKTLPVFIDGFLNPVFKKDEYENTMKGLRQRIQRILNDPSSLLSYTISDTIYKGHPYEAKTFATPISIQNITVKNLKEHHKKILSEGKFFVVVSGKVDSDFIIKELNGTLGKLKFTSIEKEYKKINPVTIAENPPTVITHTSSAGTAYITRVFSSPANSDSDYIPCALAGNIYTDILFNVVREHYGICYSPQSYVIGSKAPYGIEHLFKVSDFKNFTKAMTEARNYMEKGITIEKTNEDGSYDFSSLEENLDSYKNSYINQMYQSQATSSGQISILGYNLLQFNDIDYDLKQLKQIKETSADDIKSVFKKYWVEQPSAWFAITGPDTHLEFSSQEQ